MSKEYVPGSLIKTLLGEKVKKVDDKLDALFKNSAGPAKLPRIRLNETIITNNPDNNVNNGKEWKNKSEINISNAKNIDKIKNKDDKQNLSNVKTKKRDKNKEEPLLKAKVKFKSNRKIINSKGKDIEKIYDRLGKFKKHLNDQSIDNDYDIINKHKHTAEANQNNNSRKRPKTSSLTTTSKKSAKTQKNHVNENNMGDDYDYEISEDDMENMDDNSDNEMSVENGNNEYDNETSKDDIEEEEYDDNDRISEEEKDIVEPLSKPINKNDPEQSERTIFIGNLPVSVIQKENFKKLKSQFSIFGKIESIRFRSIAFSEPLPRKISFITKKLHPKRDILNAYILYKEKSSVEDSLLMNAKIFMDKHIRVDSVANPQAQEEELWQHFKNCGDIDYVRIVRDAKTNLGKGFAYIQFKLRDVSLVSPEDWGGLDGIWYERYIKEAKKF
ncbi:6445_t:CDS:2 [Entrophospora sp. SA101]|nr:6445_t:CDS:2 [Entrophospora sp. SA101]